MKAYVVRVIHSRMIVGFFCTDSIPELHYWVDTVADPGACEYRSVKAGGIAWPKASPLIPFPVDENSDNDDGEESSVLANAGLTESWNDAFFDHKSKWQPMGPMQYGPTAARPRQL